MKRPSIFTFSAILFSFVCLSACGTATPRDPGIKTAELIRQTKPYSYQLALDPKALRLKLSQFQSILKKKRALTPDEWLLHDELLEAYIQIKQMKGFPSSIYLPAKSRVVLPLESFCLDGGMAIPASREIFVWKRSDPGVPYAQPVLKRGATMPEFSREDLQALLWNLRKGTLWENYPTSSQKILKEMDPQAPVKLPSKVRERLKNSALEAIQKQTGQDLSFIQDRYEDYEAMKERMRELESSYALEPEDGMAASVPETPAFAETAGEGFEAQELTLYNPSTQEVIVDLSRYHLVSKRPDVQRLALLLRDLISDSLFKELERTLFDDMVRLGFSYTPVLGDLIDLIEAVQGKNFFTDEVLSRDERFMSAMGVLAGSGETYRYARKVLHGPVSYVKDVQGKYRRIRNSASHKKLEELAVKAQGKGIPDDWVVKASRLKEKDQGLEFIHPQNEHTRIRVMPGDPGAPHEISRDTYVVMKKDGRYLTRDGSYSIRDSSDTHIPLDDFDFKMMRLKK